MATQLTDHIGDVDGVSWSQDGMMIASCSSNGVVNVYSRSDTTFDLYQYLEEDSCRFDADTDELVWKVAKPNLFKSPSLPFRNIPRGSTVGIAQRYSTPDASMLEQRDWNLYLRFLDYENWATALFLFNRLDQKQRSNQNKIVVYSLSRLAETIGNFSASKDLELCRSPLELALRICDDLPSDFKDGFDSDLARSLAENGVEPGDLGQLLDDYYLNRK